MRLRLILQQRLSSWFTSSQLFSSRLLSSKLLSSQPLLSMIVICMCLLLLVMLAVNTMGLVTAEKIEVWIRDAQTISTALLVAVIISLLLVDLLLSIPTLLIAVLSGFFLGTLAGAATTLGGLFLTVSLGYVLGGKCGEAVLTRFFPNPEKRQLLEQQFQAQAPLLIIFARAVPMLPEITALLAGSQKMHYLRFIGYWALGTAPYCLIASYSGAQSSPNDPLPALAGMLALMVGLWVIAGGFKWYLRSKQG